MLKTLPKAEFLNGFAEIIKYGVIADKMLFDLLEKSSKKILSGNPEILRKIIIQCTKIKASIIEKDEAEIGSRITLNYGHTVGHAIERLSKYKIGHGQAIAYGILIANKIANNLNVLKVKDFKRINNLLIRLNLIGKTKENTPKFTNKIYAVKLWSIMQSDKKMQRSKIHFILPNTIGKTIIYDRITKKDFIKAFDQESK